jgi:hypothetical protein
MNWRLIRDREWIKSWPRRLKLSFAVIIGGIGLILISTLLNDVLNDQSLEVARLRDQLNGLRAQTANLRRQVEQYPELRRHYEQAVAAGLLNAPDRVNMLQTAQERASHYSFADLTYKLDVEDIHPAPLGRFHINAVRVAFELGAPLDIDVLSFWDDLLASIPGHYQIVNASIDRVGELDAKMLAELKSHHPVSLVKAKLTLHWMALGAPGQDAQ